MQIVYTVVQKCLMTSYMVNPAEENEVDSLPACDHVGNLNASSGRNGRIARHRSAELQSYAVDSSEEGSRYWY